jgi:hypothetical protein
MSFIFFSGLAHFYYLILKAEMNLYFYLVEDGLAEIKMGVITEVDLEAQLFGPPGNEKITYIKTITRRIGRHEVSPPEEIRSRSQYLRSLTMNMVPMIALMLATPGLGIISWKRKLLYLLLSIILLNTTHLFHLYLFYRSNYFPIHWQEWKFLKTLILELFTFWEALGRPISPLLIWLLFYNPVIFKFIKVNG